MVRFSFLFAIFVMSCIILLLSSTNVFAQPVVQVKPTCGASVPGFEITVNSNGFKPNSNIKWKLVNSDGKIPYIGYFQSNGTGGFNDVTSLDDLISGNYKLYFGTDRNELDSPLEGNPKLSVDITIPCATGMQTDTATVTSNSSIDNVSDIQSADIVLLSQRIKNGNDIIGQVKNIGNDTADFVKIGLTTYDKNGDVLGTDFTYASVQTLNPNQKSSFDMLSPKDNFIGMNNYELSLHWRNSDGTDGYVDNAKAYKDQNIVNSIN